jgi:isopentenyl-diphosphate delta-isomerase
MTTATIGRCPSEAKRTTVSNPSDATGGTVDDEIERVILVDEGDAELGTAPKLAAHHRGQLHRALSVIVCDLKGRILLQKRHIGKYHSGGLWTNTCCSHPRPGEAVNAAASRRLLEEMGFSCLLLPLFSTIYRAELGSSITEHELVHIFGGVYAGPVRPDPAEVDGYAWTEPDWLRRDLSGNPAAYSVWFRKYLLQHWSQVTAPEPWIRLHAARDRREVGDTGLVGCVGHSLTDDGGKLAHLETAAQRGASG